MNTRKIFGYGLIAVIVTLVFAALSLTGCGNPEGGPTGELSTLSGNISINPSGTVPINTELTAAYSGTETVIYQWYKDNTAIPGETSVRFTPTTAGSYTVMVSAAGYKSKTSAAVTVTAIDTTDIDFSGTVTITPAGPVATGTELTATYSGTETVSYQWKKDNSNVGANSNKYTPTTAGSYTVTVSAAGYNSKTSAAVTVIATTAIPIVNAEISIVAPVNGTTPHTTATGTGEFTIGAVSWSPADNPFKGGVVYTATVTLTANTGHTFLGLTHATINGQTANVSNNTGAAVTLSHTFPATDTRIATALAIKTQPTKLTYTHGEQLDLTGLVVTLTFDDTSSDDVLAANFAARNITADPAHGDHLVHLTHNNHPVKVEYGNLEKDTNNLTVSPKVITFAVAAIPAQTYTGSAHEPTVIVRDGTIELTPTEDYTVAYADNTNAGTATVTITGAGNYAGSSASVTFTIKQEAEFTITFEQITEGAPNLTVPPIYRTSANGIITTTVSVTEATQYSSIEWYIDGSLRRTGATLTLNAANYSIGSHTITLDVVKGGVLYNQTITFTVEN